MKILGVRIDNFSRQEILEKVDSFLSDGKFHQIATVNPEFILEAQKNAEFKGILNNSDLNVADGVGIWFAFIRYGKYLRARFAGADLMHEILKIADRKKLIVFLAVSRNSLSSYEEIHDAFSKAYPNVQFFTENIESSNENYKPKTGGYKLVLCNFGAPYQEKFINSLKNDILGVAMGVGGSFDFVTGKAKRAPKMMQSFGLEWLWRFVQEPKYRFGRIINAVIIFPIIILFSASSNE